jgi:hypothetical protein
MPSSQVDVLRDMTRLMEVGALTSETRTHLVFFSGCNPHITLPAKRLSIG